MMFIVVSPAGGFEHRICPPKLRLSITSRVIASSGGCGHPSIRSARLCAADPVSAKGETSMTVPLTPFLKTALRVDAAVSGATALLMVAGAGLLGPFLGLSVPLLFWAGVALLPFAALLIAVARRERASGAVLFDIVLLNTAWVIASFAILVAGVVEPNMTGVAFIVAQALAVALFALLQVSALHQAREAAA